MKKMLKKHQVIIFFGMLLLLKGVAYYSEDIVQFFKLNIASEVNKRLRGNKTVSKPKSGLYRVRKSWSDVKSQKGAFKNLENAKRCADRFGLKVFDANGKIVYPVSKTIDQLAREVISGKWGNGEERKRRLTDAGYDYYAIQRRVNQLI